MPNRFLSARWAIALLAIALAVPAFGQYGSSTGGIQGRVTDEQGGVLPGVQVTLKGPGAPVTVYTDARGEFRAANLDAGTYTLTLSLSGFQNVNRENVAVNIGRNTELTIPMGLTRVEAAVTVSSEAPLLETKRVMTSAIVSQQELKSIPTARDPWVVLQSAPGVAIDRINVAGSESGQQSNFSAHGSAAGTFTVDGVNLTDMSALGSSAAYYDFDMFQEMQVITGGGDASIAGAGAHLNMVTKRGTNDVHGSARVFGVDDRFESSNLPDEAFEQEGALGSGNHIQSLQDYGAEAGGPVWKDHLWLWGAYGRDQINLITAGGASDKTTLENLNAKLNWQIVPSNAANGWWMHSDKLKFGRSAGPTRPQETTWDQTLPQNTWKVEDSQVFSSSLFASAQYNGVNGNFTLDPEGGNRQVFLDEGGVWHNSYAICGGAAPDPSGEGGRLVLLQHRQPGPRAQGRVRLPAGGRPLALDLAGRRRPVRLAGGVYGDLFDCTDADGNSLPCVAITRQSNLVVDNKYWSGYLQDTFSFDRLSINAGIRWDQQTGENAATVVPGNPSFPNILPAIDYPGSGEPFTWEDWQPRLGITYALGQSRSTVLKASYARYADALGTGTVDNINPVAGISYALLWLERREPQQPGRRRGSQHQRLPVLPRLRPGEPGCGHCGGQLRFRLPRTSDRRVPGRNRPRALPGVCGRRGLHVSQVHGSALPLPHRPDPRRLRSRSGRRGRPPRRHSLQRSAVRDPRRRRRASGLRLLQPGGLRSDVSRDRPHPDEASCQPLDGARQLHLQLERAARGHGRLRGSDERHPGAVAQPG